MGIESGGAETRAEHRVCTDRRVAMAGNTSQGSSGGNGWLIGGGVLLALLVIFILQNTESVTFKFLFWSHSLPLWLVLVITALVAFVIGQFALMWRRHKRRQARRDAR
jgi:uncharacterized integral membrane protein